MKKNRKELDNNQEFLKKETYAKIPYIKEILGDLSYRHGGSFMVKKEGERGRYPRFGQAVKNLVESSGVSGQLEALNSMEKE